VTTLWADKRVYYPVHAVPYTPARHFAKGKNDPAFRTKLAIGADLAIRARAAGFAFRAAAAGCRDDFLHRRSGVCPRGHAARLLRRLAAAALGKPAPGRAARKLPVCGDHQRRGRVRGELREHAQRRGVLTAFIPWLEVLPGYQGRGIGSELMRRILDGTDQSYSVDLVCDAALLPYYVRPLRHGLRIECAAALSDRAGGRRAARSLTPGPFVPAPPRGPSVTARPR
jgi:ribosomal protein S18 acetylase RimI-like enzyme